MLGEWTCGNIEKISYFLSKTFFRNFRSLLYLQIVLAYWGINFIFTVGRTRCYTQIKLSKAASIQCDFHGIDYLHQNHIVWTRHNVFSALKQRLTYFLTIFSNWIEMFQNVDKSTRILELLAQRLCKFRISHARGIHDNYIILQK